MEFTWGQVASSNFLYPTSLDELRGLPGWDHKRHPFPGSLGRWKCPNNDQQNHERCPGTQGGWKLLQITAFHLKPPKFLEFQAGKSGELGSAQPAMPHLKCPAHWEKRSAKENMDGCAPPKSKIETTQITFGSWFDIWIWHFVVPCQHAFPVMSALSVCEALNGFTIMKVLPHAESQLLWAFVDKSKVESPKTSDVKSRDTFAWRYSCEILWVMIRW